jgi:exopolyphosphatase/guanosine-5'-triphosphate,3'-diphosphate pyrophosphatase
MPKITAVIDIGSNSARMAIFERTSRFGFHLIKEIKSKVRISEDSYENNGELQSVPMQRAISAIEGFLRIARQLKANKVLCVATSATRDAPNKSQFISILRDKLKLNIKVIDGEKEAFYGGLSALNLLNIENGITVDVGGGSTECALIKDGKVSKLISLNLGTIRLKELFFDKKAPIESIRAFISKELERIDSEFRSDTVVGIGGTTRAISKSFMKSDSYPLNSIHGYEYLLDRKKEKIDKIVNSSVLNLKSLNIKKDRIDTIREGAIIFSMLIELFEAKRVITSGVGVREGVFLSDLLRSSKGKFPANFNVSARSLMDRFVSKEYQRVANYNQAIALRLFQVLKPLHSLDDSFKSYLKYAIKLLRVGDSLNFYNSTNTSSYFILSNLNYGFTHKDRIFISLLIKFSDKRLPKEYDIKEFDNLAPDIDTLRWLSFIIILAEHLNTDFSNPIFESISLNKSSLFIKSNSSLYLAKEILKGVDKPTSLAVIINR